MIPRISGRHSFLPIVALLVVGCDSTGVSSPGLVSARFLANDSVYAGVPGGTFSMNLLFSTEAHSSRPSIREVRLLPEASFLEVTDFSLSENDPGEGVRRWHLGVGVRADAPGSHQFTSIELMSSAGAHTVPLGALTVHIEDGMQSPVFPLFAGAGVHPEPEPYEFDVRNTAGEQVTLVDVVLPHSKIHFDRSSIQVDSAPLPPQGYTLEPGRKVPVKVAWRVDWPPPGPVNLEARGLLAVERAGRREWAGLHNMVFRKDPALD